MSATPSSTSAPIEPFWNRLPKITRYPLHMGAMVVIVLFALGNLLRFVPFGGIAVLLISIAMYKYAFECLRATASGYMEPPDASAMAGSNVGWKFFWLMVILVFVIMAGFMLLGAFLGGLLLVFVAISLPGATMTLAMEDSLAEALNPSKWIAIMGAIGWPYIALILLSMVIALSQAYAAALVAKVLPLPLAVVAVGVISNYGLVVTFHLMGYLLYQFHAELGIVPEAPQLLARPLGRPDRDQDVLDAASALVRDGKPEDAAESLRQHLRVRGGTPMVHGQYRKLLRIAGNNDELLRHGREYLNILYAQENDAAALELLRECQAIDPTFVPEDATLTTRLAQKAAQTLQPKIAVQLLSGFAERFPKNQHIPENGLLEAKLLLEAMNEDERARDVLLKIKAAYPQSALMPQIDAQIAVTEKIMAASKKA